MSKSTKPKTKAKLPEVELHPDAWDRFEEMIDKVVKAPPQHRPAKEETAKRR